MVANLSACGQADSEALVDCLRHKNEEEILDINKVWLNGCGFGGRGHQVCGRQAWVPFTVLGKFFWLRTVVFLQPSYRSLL